jgi:AcrR family transcriptional regulator
MYLLPVGLTLVGLTSVGLTECPGSVFLGHPAVEDPRAHAGRVATMLRRKPELVRNFSTKDDLLLEMFRRDREAVLAQLREIVARAEAPIDALQLWMMHMFDIILDPRRRRRMTTFYSDEMRRTPGYPRELELFATAEEAALAAILHKGRADGTFTACAPESDARSIRAAFEAAFLDRFQQKSTTKVADDVEQLLGFVLRGLGAVEHIEWLSIETGCGPGGIRKAGTPTGRAWTRSLRPPSSTPACR